MTRARRHADDVTLDDCVRSRYLDAMVLKAKVTGGRLTLDEPTDLPEGTELDLVVAEEFEDEMSSEERARLHASIRRGIADAGAGRTVDAETFLSELESGA